MRLPYLNEIPTAKSAVSVFGGYNHNIRTGDGEFYHMENMTSDHYPVLSPRAPRYVYKRGENIGALISKSKLCYVDGTAIVIGDKRVDMELTDESKHLISMGAYIIIMPDKKYINTANTEDRGELDAKFESAEGATLTLCREDGSVYNNVLAWGERPAIMDERIVWLDMSNETPSLRQYYASTGSWGNLNSYIRIECAGINEKFSVGDGVTVSGIDAIFPEGTGKYHTISAVGVNDGGKGYIVIPGIILPPKGSYDDDIEDDGEADIITVTNEVDGEIIITREMPSVDHMTERGNRLWGCRYGKSADDEFVNEIYVSKASDHKNWNSYAGISTDSYTVTVGSDGPFTAAAALGDCTLFFKENRIHKVYGAYTGSFSTGEIICEGVEAGSEKSIAQIGGVLYYKGRTGVWAYDGSMPVMISEAFGNVSYCDATACAHGTKYYISMRECKSGEWHLFVYDTEKRMWHREDSTNALSLASHEGELYISAGGAIYTTKTADTYEYAVKWSVDSGLIFENGTGNCYISKLTLQISLTVDTVIRTFIEYDSSGEWESAGAFTGTRLGAVSIPLRLRRCNHFRIRIEGEGEAKLLSLTKHITRGDDN